MQTKEETLAIGTAGTGRIAAIDWMRGFVMVLMAVDHASQMWNAGRVAADSAYLLDPVTGGPLWVPGTALDPAQFATRWITHLCAPTFLFLSGTSLAMSLEKRRGLGARERDLDRHLFVRALVILGFEGLLSVLADQGIVILQVLFAIGTSMLAMIGLRRLPTGALVALGAGWLVAGELVLGAIAPPGGVRSLPEILFLVPGYAAPFYSIYPMTHWLAMMLLGWAFGRAFLRRGGSREGRLEIEKGLLFGGTSALFVAFVLRGANGYGNLFLLRDDRSIVQWLHMSKYPPALVYTLTELGLMALGLVVCLAIERRLGRAPSEWNPLLVLGQTALFFYVLHFIVLGGSALAITGGMMQRGLPEAWLAAAATLVVLYPVCLGFRALKRRYPRSVLQYV